MTQLAVPESMPGKMEYAKALALADMLPPHFKQKPANLLWALEFASMVGMPPMSAITGVHVIQGRPVPSAALISALVRRAGHRLRVSGNDERAVAEITRADDPDFTFQSIWTMDRARKAGLLNKDTWKSYPASMLKARAITEVARDACEDALMGLPAYSAEELGAVVDEEGNPVERAARRVTAADILAPAPKDPPPVDEQTGEIGWPAVAQVPE